MNAIDKLAEYFSKFPGIGERQARRFVYFLLHTNDSYREELVNLIHSLKKEIKQCESCFVFSPTIKENKCENCLNKDIDNSMIMIVEKDADYENIKRSGILPLIGSIFRNMHTFLTASYWYFYFTREGSGVGGGL